MRVAQLRQADLNLLVVFSVLAEERSVSRAAPRLALSQPAVSRALGRLRDTFGDDLMVRGPRGYEPTPKGRRLLQELSSILPRLDRLLAGGAFDPSAEEAAFRVTGTDNAALVLCPPLCRALLAASKKASLSFAPWHDGVFEDLERGRLDLAFVADDGRYPDSYHREVIYKDEFACVVARESRYVRRLTLKQYVGASHVRVVTLGGRQTIPEQRLSALGHKRACPVEVPYFVAAMRCVPGTDLVATVPERLVMAERDNPAIKVLAPPPELAGFNYLMLWHPRVNTDAAHQWLRSIVRAACDELAC